MIYYWRLLAVYHERIEDAVLEKNIGCGNQTKRIVSTVDLFCGAGGLSNGLKRAGIDISLGIDIDPACEYPFSFNNGAEFLLKSVEELNAEELEGSFKKNDFRLLAGCAPCQTFSPYYKKAAREDKRWWLLLDFARLVKEVSPELVTMENVPTLQNHEVFEEFLRTLFDSGYFSDINIVNCEDYGIPQHRRRLVLVASRLGPIRMMTPDEFGRDRTTIRDWIADLPPLRAGETDRKDPLHQSSSLSELNKKRIEASRPGGSWREWEEALIAKCHKKESGKTYPGVYGRMSWDEPAPTITTQFFGFGSGRFGHPEQDRAISLREGAILQGFPRDYAFTPPGAPIRKKEIGRLIGNAVPPMLGEVIGKSIVNHVNCWIDEKCGSSWEVNANDGRS